MQRDTGLFTWQDLIAITDLYLCIYQEKVLLIIFSRENSLVSLCMIERNNLAFAIIAPSKRIFVFAELILTLRQTVFIRNKNADYILS